MIRILIVDDHPAVRHGLRALIDGEPGMAVAGLAVDAEAALAAAEDLRPDVVLLDVHLPGEDGLSLCLRLGGARPRPRLVLYSAFADEALGLLGAIAGADALVPKSADPEELLMVLRDVADGGRALGPPSGEAMRTLGALLDPADLPVLGMLVHATPPGEVAQTLGMPPEWLLARRWAMLRRLGPRRVRRGATASPVPAGWRSE